MGHRNAWRPSLDSRTGFLYWGEVGPDAAEASEITVEGYDEFNQARRPGYYGWPYFIGPNRAYPITDYETGEILPPKDPARPLNDSRNNTGLKQLPPAQSAFISYPYAASEQFPEVGSGSRCAVGGPIYHRADWPKAVRPWPEYYEGKWLVTDCSRNWIMAITMNENSEYESMERFLPAYNPVEPLDMKFGPTGDLYVLEYGSTWFAKSPDTKLVRIEYNAGNRAPEVEVSANTTGGALPFRVTLSSAGSKDPDNDALKYEWKIAPAAGGAAQTFATADAAVTLDRAGVYTAVLTATDPSGAQASDSLRLVAGNEPPDVALQLTGGNQTFFFPGQPIGYAVRVSDRDSGAVDTAKVALSIDYVPEGFDPGSIAQGDNAVDASTQFAVARHLIANSDCSACHKVDTPRSVGPSFTEVAAKYQGNAGALAHLVEKIRGGGSGVWGDVTMPAHPGLSVAEATAIARYVLSTNSSAFRALPLAGSYTPETPEGDNGAGSVIVRAAYSDGGVGALPAQTTERMVVLRSPTLGAGSADIIENATATAAGRGAGPVTVHPKANAYIAFRKIDLTGISHAEIAAAASARDGDIGGTVEFRLDSPTGELVGQAPVTLPPPPDPDAPRVRGGGRPTVPVDLKAVSGTHDLYLVFKNDQARPFQPLMTLAWVRLGR
jgi:cytochrome c